MCRPAEPAASLTMLTGRTPLRRAYEAARTPQPRQTRSAPRSTCPTRPFELTAADLGGHPQPFDPPVTDRVCEPGRRSGTSVPSG